MLSQDHAFLKIVEKSGHAFCWKIFTTLQIWSLENHEYVTISQTQIGTHKQAPLIMYTNIAYSRRRVKRLLSLKILSPKVIVPQDSKDFRE